MTLELVAAFSCSATAEFAAASPYSVIDGSATADSCPATAESAAAAAAAAAASSSSCSAAVGFAAAAHVSVVVSSSTV